MTEQTRIREWSTGRRRRLRCCRAACSPTSPPTRASCSSFCVVRSMVSPPYRRTATATTRRSAVSSRSRRRNSSSTECSRCIRRSRSCTSAIQAKELIVFHAVASPYRERSHFDGQDLLENGTSTPKAAHDGWLNRALPLLPEAKRRATDQIALALAQNVPLVLRGDARVEFVGAVAIAGSGLGHSAAHRRSVRDRRILREPSAIRARGGQRRRRRDERGPARSAQCAEHGRGRGRQVSRGSRRSAHRRARSRRLGHARESGRRARATRESPARSRSGVEQRCALRSVRRGREARCSSSRNSAGPSP